jgi:hypothetical protein
MQSIIIPRAPEPLKGFIRAVGKDGINDVSIPKTANAELKPSVKNSNAPEFLKTPIAIKIATMYGIDGKGGYFTQWMKKWVEWNWW